MKITYYQCDRPNFGDELNVWMWPRLLPGFFDDNKKTAFLGIGSIIGMPVPFAEHKIIFGAGYVEGYNQRPDVSGASWDVRFVRGPRTAAALNLPSKLALGDAAILLRTLPDLPLKTSEVISFIPHWESIERGNWLEVCRRAGMNYIDPTLPVEIVLRELCRSRLVIAEAMHGAIVADALRIPWLPLLPIKDTHRAKWYDWSESLDINLRPYRLWPSSLTEASLAFIRYPFVIRIIQMVKNSFFAELVEKWIMRLATYRLRRAQMQPGQLSSNAKIEEITAAMLAKVEQLRFDYQPRTDAPVAPIRA